jgi:small subunit ribosomal protein S8
MTDPIADFLARLRNAIIARKAKVEIPSSKMKRRIAEILRDEGFVASVEDKQDELQGLIVIQLRYGHDHANAISGIRRVSRPGQRRYVSKDKLPRVRSGLGTSLLTTSRGIMTDRAARKAGIGGEVICEVW